MKLHISQRLKKLLPAHTTEERQQLQENIEADGEILDPILYWNDGKRFVVVDGMNRFEIARKRNLSYKATEVHVGDTYEDAELWILSHQLGRRNLLDPHALRKVRGDLYNRLKRKDGGHGDQLDHTPQSGRAGCQNDTPLGENARQSASNATTAAEKVAEKAGVSPSTVKRDGARAKALESLTKPAQTAAEKATDAEVKRLAKCNTSDQNAVARAIRTGQAKTVSEAMKQTGAKPPKPDKPAKPKPPKKFDRPACYKQWDQAIGPVVRTVNKIANDVGEKDCQSHKAILEHLEACTETMAAWMGVK